MEKLQGPINPCFLGNHLNADYFEQEFITNEAFSFAEEEEEEGAGPNFDTTTTSSLEDKMPFLQMLQGVENPSLFPSKEPSFQTLLRIQHLRKPWDMLSTYIPEEMETQIQALEFESYVTKEILDFHLPVKSETRDLQNPQLQSLTSSVEGLNSESNHQEQHMQFQLAQPTNSGVKMTTHSQQQHTGRGKQTQFSKSPPVTREKRKRKRTKPIKNKEEVESQRMTHIAVERNRRRQMNDHLNTLRSLMPLSYFHRGDQASIIGGAIDFVKELEQLLQSLEEQKRMRMGAATSRTNAVEGCDSAMSTTTTTTTTTSSEKAILSNGYSGSRSEIGNCCEEKMKAEINSDEADIEVVVIQNHVNLKIQCPKTPGRLLKAIVALEDLKLTFLHLNIASSECKVHYSFNLKIEEDCKLGSAEEIAAAVHQICSYVNSS